MVRKHVPLQLCRSAQGCCATHLLCPGVKPLGLVVDASQAGIIVNSLAGSGSSTGDSSGSNDSAGSSSGSGSSHSNACQL